MADYYRPRRRSRAWVWLTLLILLIGGLWIAYWYGASWVAGKVLARAEGGGLRGITLTCPDRRMGGFPFAIEIDCSATRVAMAGAGEVTAGAVDAEAPLYLPGRVTSAIAGPLKLSVPALRLSLAMDWRAATAGASVMPSGLKRLEATFDDVKLAVEAGGRRLPLQRLAATDGWAEIGASRSESGSLDLAGGGDALVVVDGRGKELPVFDANARVTLIGFGSTIGQDPTQAFRAWLAAGGKMYVKRFRFAVGDIVVHLEGPLMLSPEGLLSGNLTLRIVGLAALPAVIETFRPGSRDKAQLAAQGLALLSKPVQTEDGQARETIITIRDGDVSAGIIPIDTIPPLMP